MEELASKREMIVQAMSKTPPFSLSKKSLNNLVNFISPLYFRREIPSKKIQFPKIESAISFKRNFQNPEEWCRIIFVY
jgi:hypothetical protein